MNISRENSIGVMISNDVIVITQVGHSGAGSTKIDKSVIVDMPEGLVQDGLIKDAKAFAQILRRTFSENGINNRKVNAAVLDPSIVLHPAKFKRLPEEQLKISFRKEIDRYMPYGDEPVMDHYQTSPGEGYIVAIKRSVVNALIAATDKAGLKLVGVDIVPLSILRALSHGGNIDTKEDKAVVMILCGANTDVLVIKEGIPVYSRTLSAEDIRELAREVSMTLTYWEEQNPGMMLTKTLILGDTARAKELSVELSDGSNVVEQGKPMGMIPEKFDLTQSASIGLALREEKNPLVFDINLLPLERIKKIRLEKLFFNLVGIIGLISIMSLTLSVVLSQVEKAYMKRIAPTRDEVISQADILISAEEINKQKTAAIKRLNRREVFISSIDVEPWPDILDNVRKFIPMDVWLTEVSSQRGSGVLIRGRAFSPDAVYAYVRLLDFSEYFNEPQLSFLEEEDGDEGIHEFSIICGLCQ